MPVVPGLPNINPQNALGTQEQPSNTNLMMAMSEMRNLGKFQQDAAPAKGAPASSARPMRQINQQPKMVNKTLRHLGHNKMGR